MLELLHPLYSRAIGVDASSSMLAVARANLDRAGIGNVQVRLGDIYNLPLPRDSFNLVVVHQVLHFLDDPERALAEAARVLRPGGRLLIVDFAPHELEFLREDHAHRRLGFGRDQVGQWIRHSRPARSTRWSICRSGDDDKLKVIAVARPRPADRHRRRATIGRWRDAGQWKASEPAARRRLRPERLLRVLPAEDAGDGGEALAVDRAAGAAGADLRLGHLRRRRLDPRAHPCDRRRAF